MEVVLRNSFNNYEYNENGIKIYNVKVKSVEIEGENAKIVVYRDNAEYTKTFVLNLKYTEKGLQIKTKRFFGNLKLEKINVNDKTLLVEYDWKKLIGKEFKCLAYTYNEKGYTSIFTLTPTDTPIDKLLEQFYNSKTNVYSNKVEKPITEPYNENTKGEDIPF